MGWELGEDGVSVSALKPGDVAVVSYGLLSLLGNLGFAL